VEIVIKICKEGKKIAEKFAGNYFDEIGIGIDFTARDLQQKQKDKGLPWEIAKAFDHSAPVGEFRAVSSFADLHAVSFSLKKNGNIVQQGNTSDMIFSFEKIIAYVSSYFTLRKGDLIFTGTPAGVSSVHKGDRIEAYIEDEKLLDFEVR
jgi:2-keto-4-pentenoate hydratase/2-oxohepta-3-ene-1,7-dioic acid hydratase in catechol pathway